MPSTPSTPALRQRAAPSTAGEHDSPTPSQLDILAERNERFATPSLLRRATPVLAIGAFALLLGALLWWVAQRTEPAAPNASAASIESAVMAPAAAPDTAASGAGVTSTAASDGPAAEALPTAVAAPAATSSPVPAQDSPPPGLAPVERARKAQARRDAAARANASPSPAQRQPREIDKARDTPAAAETRNVAGPATPGAETASRPRPEAAAAGVREFCAARGNIVSQLFCHSRECRKPERARDATCVRLKEIEEAQRRVEPQ